MKLLVAVWDALSEQCRTDLKHAKPGSIIRCTVEDLELLGTVRLTGEEPPVGPPGHDELTLPRLQELADTAVREAYALGFRHGREQEQRDQDARRQGLVDKMLRTEEVLGAMAPRCDHCGSTEHHVSMCRDLESRCPT